MTLCVMMFSLSYLQNLNPCHLLLVIYFINNINILLNKNKIKLNFFKKIHHLQPSNHIIIHPLQETQSPKIKNKKS